MCDRRLMVLLLVVVLGAATPLSAVSLDGTASVKFQTTNYTFDNGNFARGFVRLNAGFTVNAGNQIFLNLLSPVAGAIDLNDTGAIVLEGDLSLQSNVTLSSGGIIDGQGYSVFMNGNLKIPTGKIIEFASDTVIDGQGHTLILEQGVPGGQLFINGPPGAKVTLRNMTLRGVRIFADGTLSIGFGFSADQSLVLENVTLQMSNDFFFFGGNLEIKGTVKIMGSFLPEFRPALQPMFFSFLSPDDCIIHKDSTLSFDTTVALIYRPIDNNNKHIIMRKPSSQLLLNGSALFVPGSTGLQLTKGHIVVAHRNFLQGTGVTDSTKPIQFGDGDIAHDVALNIYPGARLEVVDTVFRYKNQQ